MATVLPCVRTPSLRGVGGVRGWHVGGHTDDDACADGAAWPGGARGYASEAQRRAARSRRARARRRVQYAEPEVIDVEGSEDEARARRRARARARAVGRTGEAAHEERWGPRVDRMDPGALFSGSQEGAIDADVGRYLAKVYGTLGVTMGSAAVGAGLWGLVPGVAAVPHGLYSLAAFAGVMGISFTSGSSPMRMGLLQATAGASGLAMAPLIAHYFAVDPSIVYTALFGTVGIFGGFSAVALKAKRRAMLSMGGPLAGVLLGMIGIQLSTLFIDYSPSTLATLRSVFPIVGLGAFSAFVSYDTQRMIESARAGHKDHIGDSLSMFLNLRGIFMFLLQILGNRND